MFDWRKRKSAPVDAPAPNASPAELRCSFCEKAQADVRKLIAGPSVFICDECVDVCVDIIADDESFQEQPLSGDQKAARRSGPRAKEAVHCSLCGNPVPNKEVLPLGNRGVLCGECADAVEDALSQGRPAS